MRLKLVSPKDTLLGHVDVPDHWRDLFNRNGSASGAMMPRFRFPIEMTAAEIVQPVDVKAVTLVKAEWSQFRDAVCLIRGTLEEFETLPGCSFAPSAAYLRSQIS